MRHVAAVPQFQANLVAAQLGAAGILWELRGGSSVYPFVSVDLYVEHDGFDVAMALLGTGSTPAQFVAGPTALADPDRPVPLEHPIARAGPAPRRRDARRTLLVCTALTVLGGLAMRVMLLL